MGTTFLSCPSSRKCWAAKDASGARLHSSATFEGVFELGQSCRAKCDVISQKTRPLKSAAHTALVADAASGDGEPSGKTLQNCGCIWEF